MSIGDTIAPSLVLFQPGKTQEQPLPIGFWKGVSNVVGDASGGIVSLIIAPGNAVDASKYLWSVESMRAALPGVGVAVNVLLQYATAELAPVTGGPTIGMVFEMSVLLTAYPTLARAAMPADLTMDQFRHITEPSPGLTPSWAAYFDANVLARVYRLDAWGFIWDKNARKLAGGPRRY